MSNILEIKNLTIHYVTDDEVVKAVNDISIALKQRGGISGTGRENRGGKNDDSYGCPGPGSGPSWKNYQWRSYL